MVRGPCTVQLSAVMLMLDSCVCPTLSLSVPYMMQLPLHTLARSASVCRPSLFKHIKTKFFNFHVKNLVFDLKMCLLWSCNHFLPFRRWIIFSRRRVSIQLHFHSYECHLWHSYEGALFQITPPRHLTLIHLLLYYTRITGVNLLFSISIPLPNPFPAPSRGGDVASFPLHRLVTCRQTVMSSRAQTDQESGQS